MLYNQLVNLELLADILGTKLKAGDFSMDIYNVYELQPNAHGHYMESSFILRSDRFSCIRPTTYPYSYGLRSSVRALKPTFQELDFTPVAFISTNVQGDLTKKAFVDQKTKEYDMHQHQSMDTKLDNMPRIEAMKQINTFTIMEKFILRDKTTRKLAPMPCYIVLDGIDPMLNKIANDQETRNRFIAALRKMRQK